MADGKLGFESAHGSFLSARDDGTLGHADAAQGWECFELIPTRDGKHGLRTFHGTFVTAMRGGD